MARVKTLIHVHTDFSYDSNITIEQLARFCEEQRFGCVAVTDHDSIEGARRLASMTEVNVIVGEEVTTAQGHLLGLFLTEWIRPGMSALDTAKAIRAQGGLVLLPHPFVRAFGCGIGESVWRMSEWIDAVEVCNAQNLSRRADRYAREFAEACDLPQYVGADSHMNSSIAPCYQTMPEARDPQSFIRALRRADLVSGRHPLSYFASTGLRVILALARRPQPKAFGANLALARPGAQPAAASVA